MGLLHGFHTSHFPVYLQQGSATIKDQLLSKELKPSEQLSAFKVTVVLSTLFGIYSHEYRDVTNFIEGKEVKYTPNTVPISKKTTSFVETVAVHTKKTLHLKQKEASGYGILSEFAVYIM